MNLPGDPDDYVQMPSGLILPRDAAEHEIRRTQRPKAMDYYAGAGGMSLGFLQAGFEVVAAVESEPVCVVTYMSNLARYGECQMVFVTDEDQERMEKYLERSLSQVNKGRKGTLSAGALAGSGWIKHEPKSTPSVSFVFVGDSRKLDPDHVLEVIGMERGELDCVAGGPPCQGFSVAGRKDPNDSRSTVLFDFARHIVGLNPKTMVMENVPNIVNMLTPEGVPVLDKFCRILEDGGFGGFDAFQRAVKAQAGNVGIMRGRGKPARKTSAPASAPGVPDQMDLLAAE